METDYKESNVDRFGAGQESRSISNMSESKNEESHFLYRFLSKTASFMEKKKACLIL